MAESRLLGGLRLGGLLRLGLVELLALGLAQHVAVALEETEVGLRLRDVSFPAPGPEAPVVHREGQGECGPGGGVASRSGIGDDCLLGIGIVFAVVSPYAEEAAGQLVVLPGDPVTGPDEGQGKVVEQVALGDALSEDLRQVGLSDLSGSLEGVLMGPLALPLCLLLG